MKIQIHFQIQDLKKEMIMNGNRSINQQTTPKEVKKKVVGCVISGLFLMALIILFSILSCPLDCAKDSVITVGKVFRVRKGYVDFITYINGEKYSIGKSAHLSPDRIGEFYLLCINRQNKYCVNLVTQDEKIIGLGGSVLDKFLLENNLLDKDFDEKGEYKSFVLGQGIGCWILNLFSMSNSDSICGCAGVNNLHTDTD